jgi:site-specific DNA-methyltransferase (adenine-specific)
VLSEMQAAIPARRGRTGLERILPEVRGREGEMKNTIYCGECAQVMADLLPDNSIDLTVTSPPYDNLRDYNGYVFDFEAIARQLWRVTKPGGVVVWVVGDATVNGSETGTSFRQALGFMELGFRLHDTMIWQPSGVGAKGSHKAYWQAFEFMLVFAKGEIKTINRIKDKVNINAGNFTGTSPKAQLLGSRMRGNAYITPELSVRTNVWTYDVGHEWTPHPAPFPEALACDHIISWSNPGDLVFDPMCGSGTTLKMAKEAGRDYIGIDISQEYCELSRSIANSAGGVWPARGCRCRDLSRVYLPKRAENSIISMSFNQQFGAVFLCRREPYNSILQANEVPLVQLCGARAAVD